MALLLQLLTAASGWLTVAARPHGVAADNSQSGAGGGLLGVALGVGSVCVAVLLVVGCAGCGDGQKQPPPQPTVQQDPPKLQPAPAQKPAAPVEKKQPATITAEQVQQYKFTLTAGDKLEKKMQSMEQRGRFVAEFDEIEQFELSFREADRATTVALMPDHAALNRYNNVLAKDSTRVVLATGTRDYVNANHVDGYEGKIRFICAQGPLESTLEDFWRMAWEQNSGIIVMATNLVEGDRPKCSRYWPSEHQLAVAYGDFTVTWDGKEVHTEQSGDSWCTRTFTLKHEPSGASRGVVQYQYERWPDHGLPDDPAHLFSLLDAVNTSHQQLGPSAGPVLVHCSAGIGRSGTFIVCDHSCKQLKEKGTVDIYNTVLGLRKARGGLIQTSQQYRFCYEAALLYWKQLQGIEPAPANTVVAVPAPEATSAPPVPPKASPSPQPTPVPVPLAVADSKDVYPQEAED